MGNQGYSTTSGSELVSSVPERYRSLYRTGVLVARTCKPLYCSPSAHDDVDAAGLVWSFAFAEFRVWSCGFAAFAKSSVVARLEFRVFHSRQVPFAEYPET